MTEIMDSTIATPKKTFSEFDKLELEEFAHRLTDFIITERHFVDEALIISLNGGFGSGKSTFFEMWQEYLEQESSQRFSVITLNAWEADFDRDALLAIISGFVKHFESRGHKTDTDTLKQFGGKVAKVALSLGNQIVRNKLGVDVCEAKEKAEPIKPGLVAKACFEVYEDRQEAFRLLKNHLRTIIESQDTPLIIMVDELDRCRPDYAVEYLETIKHIFDLKGLVFVLGVDSKSLSSSVKALFGSDLDFDEYYRKFVHRRVSLPTLVYRNGDVLSQQKLEMFTKSLVEKYFHNQSARDAGRHSYHDWRNNDAETCAEVFSSLALTPRQIHEVFRILAHVLNVTKDKMGKMFSGWQIGVVLMASLSVSRNDIYQKIGGSKIELEDLTNFFKTSPILSDNRAHGLWWASTVFVGCFGVGDESVGLFVKLCAELGFTDEINDYETAKNKLLVRRQEYGGYPNRGELVYPKIYNMIESVQMFGQGQASS